LVTQYYSLDGSSLKPFPERESIDDAG